MSLLKTMQVLTDSAQYDLCDYASHSKSSSINLPGIYQATGANGCKIPLFKTLMSNECKNDCRYCINQSKRDFQRLQLSPEYLAKVFMEYYNKGFVNGLFLSSGIADDSNETMENMLDAVHILRKDYGYKDYIHLKIVPGASRDSIKRAMGLSNRVSINIEAATADGLSILSSTKDYNNDILKRLRWINSLRNSKGTYPYSTHTTQMIVGANGETDREILARMSKIYKKSQLKRTYFSPFSPVEGTEFENKEACSNLRTNKLYHADELLHSYGYKVRELVFDDNDQLLLDEDPKILAAEKMDIFPVEVNTGSYYDLIRVPGIGTKSAHRILAARRKRPFTSYEQLRELGIAVNRAEKYIRIKGEYQSNLDFFSDLFE